MANTLGSTSNGKAIAQRALTTLVDSLPFLTKAVTDFSDVPARMNDTITTHLVTVGTASAYSTTAGYVAADRTQTDATISLSNLVHSTYAITDAEKYTSSIDLINRFASSAAYALGKKMVDVMLDLVTASCYSSTLSVTAGALTYRGVVSLGYGLDNNKVPSNDRYAIVSPDNKASLLNDANIVANAQIQGEAVRSGSVGLVNGIEVFSYTALPSAISKGFAAQKEALIVAARVPEALDNYPGSQDVVTDPESGLSLAVREFVNPTLGTKIGRAHV